MANNKEAGKLAEQLVRETAASPTTLATQAGQTSGHQRTAAGHDEPVSEPLRDQLIEALNQVFALFRLNYHNQFYAAYPDNSQLNQIKRLWLESLSRFSPETILLAARHAIEHNDYLPTLNKMRACCQQALTHQGLPDSHSAFIEACEKPSPKNQQAWSHPAVYFAGRDSDWFFLANNSESKTFPVFQRHYERYVDLVLRGETLTLPTQPELPPKASRVLDTAEQLAALKILREETGL
jgi:hypothetical protein